MKFEATLMAVALIASEVSLSTTICRYLSLFAYILANHSIQENFSHFVLRIFQIKLVSEFIRTKQNRLIFSITNVV